MTKSKILPYLDDNDVHVIYVLKTANPPHKQSQVQKIKKQKRKYNCTIF